LDFCSYIILQNICRYYHYKSKTLNGGFGKSKSSQKLHFLALEPIDMPVLL